MSLVGCFHSIWIPLSAISDPTLVCVPGLTLALEAGVNILVSPELSRIQIQPRNGPHVHDQAYSPE